MDPSNLAKLSREEKIELLKTIEEKERRDKRKRDKFKPNSLQKQVLQSTKPTKIVTAANGVGKSALGVNFAWYRATGFDPTLEAYTKVPVKIYVILDNSSKVEATWMPEFRKWFDLEHEGVTELKHGKTYTSEIKWRNGSSLTFLSHEMDRVMFESIQCDIVIYDEPPPRWLYIAMTRGQRAKDAQVEKLLIGTPVTQEAAWIREDFVEPWKEGLLEGVECFTASTSVNEHNLRKGYVAEFSKDLKENERRVRLEGEFAVSDGLAFAHLFSSDLHQITSGELGEWGASWPCVLAIDPHPSKAHAAIIIGRRPTDGRYFILREIKAKLTARQFALKIHTMISTLRVVDIVVDSLGSADGTGNEGFKSFITILNECGLRARPTTYADKSHEATVDRIRTLLDLGEDNKPKIQFLKDMVPETIRELRNVGWLYDKRKELNKDKLDYDKLDYFSCLAYGLASNALTLINPIENSIKYAKIQNTARGGVGNWNIKRRMKRNYIEYKDDGSVRKIRTLGDLDED